jgi:Fe-S cluster biogenesis protein NfuA
MVNKMYHHKSLVESKLQERVDNAKLSDQDYRNLFWQLWGACSLDEKKWGTFENIVTHYLNNKVKEVQNVKNHRP